LTAFAKGNIMKYISKIFHKFTKGAQPMKLAAAKNQKTYIKERSE
jgi:hypothetical protein